MDRVAGGHGGERGNGRCAASAATSVRSAPLLLGALVLAALVLRVFDPAAARWPALCLLHALTGLHCPGCGATRALHALVHGDLGAALRVNALLVAALPALALASLGRVDLARRPRALAVALALTAAFGVARNVPAEPFSWLAPPPRASAAP